MRERKLKWGGVCAVLLFAAGAAAAQTLPFEPAHESGQSITGAFEGWFPNPDGTFSLLVGYYNRNLDKPMDIPVGQNNRIDPGGPDYGQPTHFIPSRAWGMFTITVPKDFGSKRLQWTIVANGKTTVIPLDIQDVYQVSPFIDATGDTPAYIGFSQNGPFVNGPKGQSESISGTVGVPVPLTVWVADDAKKPALPGGGGGRRGRPHQPVTLFWSLFRGPAGGTAKFANARPIAETIQLPAPPKGTAFDGKATTSAVFDKPGDYVLDVQAYDSTGEGGGGGFQCCWSNAKVKVSVKSAAPGTTGGD